ncbi:MULTISPECIES: hypothetical protein [unclassified Tolypothrix]|uniref:hypothetical protein n=1 Tax=unclassified Tolypothrix TaxID=2649714 RepID=UPI0005EAB142|nr:MULTISPECIES: hypothetical protein [unclassified Tolypothrix]BAY88870.1 hypothetical protein NIES3275_08700 [Microchaete diplosiphon NIES-3275]EKF03229.1 hypothetical protein FDUTEX481_05510 [Tolypothrix sp. PCC 7601]MBE9085769.1 hypothetical protein [Tolypothrix sp. LEGE 11397]UYD29514.1 hypothetical protein HGR01_16720 [Tolypothrix sp. PCC 7712]UYD34574.1 hypothetical protein HG267_01585 [Tolypothrix sp. PCC 7601]
MNEAETSNNGAFIESLNSANSPQTEEASCPFYAVVPSENIKQQPLLLQPAKDEQPETQAPDLPVDATKQDWVAEPDIQQQLLVNAEFQKLLALNQELRSANDDLYEQVEHLKDELTDAQKAIQWQKKRFGVTESMLNQQTQELNAAQEQIKSLFEELETAVQGVQRQEIFIETYKAQLQISQQRLAQLERECSLLQTNYSEQSQQLLQSENTCRELRTRLMRQQRQTLQFKAALEKCLEPPVTGDESSEDTTNRPRNTNRQSRFTKKARSLFPNAQPIKPWSAESESLDDSSQESSAASHPTDEPSVTPSSPWDWSNRENTSTTAKSEAASESTPFVSSSPSTENSSTPPQPISPLGSSSIDELDSLIQMFFAAQPTSTPPNSTVEITVESQPAKDVTIWETVAKTVTDEEETNAVGESKPTPKTSKNTEGNNISSSAKKAAKSNTQPVANTTVAPENDDYWAEIPQINQVDVPNANQNASGDAANDNPSPSPVVYPQRPPKGRKSLASVELPNFRQKRQ